jgi:hypothetical protein
METKQVKKESYLFNTAIRNKKARAKEVKKKKTNKKKQTTKKKNKILKKNLQLD